VYHIVEATINEIQQGVFSMNFFTLDQETFRFVVSPKLWIYFVSAVVLTLYTLLMYFGMAEYPQLHRRRKSMDAEILVFWREKLSGLGTY
jgi:hypothetical protein